MTTQLAALAIGIFRPNEEIASIPQPPFESEQVYEMTTPNSFGPIAGHNVLAANQFHSATINIGDSKGMRV
jgi:hypothetical protein